MKRLMSTGLANTSFTGCGNNGLEVTNNYATGDGPPTDHPQTIVLDIINSRISGSHYYNLWVNNISPLTNLNVKVQNSDLSGSTAGVGVGFDSFFGYAIATPGGGTGPVTSQTELLELLDSWGIPVAPHHAKCATLAEVHAWATTSR